jgi:polysaccharide biosynthesis/export protein
LRIVPKDPYHVESLDSLTVSVEGTLPDQPIRGLVLVDPSGNIDLGPAYGKVQVVGKTLDGAIEAVESHLQKILARPQVSIVLAQSGGQIQIQGQRIVAMDGTVSLGSYGSVYVAGMTKDQAKLAIEKHLQQFLEDPVIAVDVFGYNSKKYYIITEGAGQGDKIQDFPLTGNETVLDAISLAGGIGPAGSMQVWIARPAPGEIGCSQILPINWKDIVKNGNSSTNYQIMQNDRIIIAEDRMLAYGGMIGKFTQPFERMFNISVLGASTISTTRRFPNGQGGGGGGFF